MSIPKEPRQLMINLLYLVLIAMLALNVTSEVLNAFNTVNDGIVETNFVIDDKNKVTYTLLEQLKENANEDEVEYINRAQQAKLLSIKLESTIDSIKSEMIERAGGIDSTGIIKNNKNIEIAGNFMVKEEKGKEIQEEVNKIRKQFLMLFDEEERAAFDELMVKVEDPVNDEYDRDWATASFERVPVIAAVTILSQLQSDIKTTEATVVNYLLDQVRLGGFKFDQVAAQVVSNSSYVLAGETYKANIFPAMFDSSQTPNVYFGSLDRSKLKTDPSGKFLELRENPIRSVTKQMKAKNGMVEYAALTSSPGNKYFEGVIEIFDQKGKAKYYPFKNSYTVGTSSAVVSPTKMNVLYTKVKNPVEISAPGIRSDRIKASIDNGTITDLGGGKYEITASRTGEATVTVRATLENGQTKTFGTQKFRVKNIPWPDAHIGQLTSSSTTRQRLAAHPGISLDKRGFDFAYNFSVKGYKVMIVDGKDIVFDEVIGGGDFPKKLKDAIKRAKKGSNIFFDDIVVVGQQGERKKEPTIAYKLN